MKLALIRDSLRITPRPRLLWVAEFVLNPLLFAGFWLWLLLPEASVFQLLLGLFLIGLVGVVFLALVGATLSCYGELHAGGAPTLRSSFGKGLRHFPWLAIWGLVLVAGYLVVDWAEGYQYQLPTYLRSLLPAALRARLTEERLLWLFLFLLGVVFWVILPALWLPPAAQLAARGFRGFGREGFRAWVRSLKSLQYWLTLALAALIGVYAPIKLMDWTPKQGTSLNLQMTSMVVRLVVAYVLALFAWMWAASAVGRAGAPKPEAAAK